VADVIVYLYGGEPNPNDVELSDPTVLRGGVVVYSYTGTGGIVFAGVATYSEAWAYAGSGGITFGGVAAVTETWAYAGAGGILFGGAATYAEAWAYAGAGGILFGGAATFLEVWAYAAAGGIVFGGGAATSYVPAANVTYFYTGSGGIFFGGQSQNSGPIFIDDDSGFLFRRYVKVTLVDGVQANVIASLYLSARAIAVVHVSGVEARIGLGEAEGGAGVLSGADPSIALIGFGQAHASASTTASVASLPLSFGSLGQARVQIPSNVVIFGPRGLVPRMGFVFVLIGPDLVEQELEEILLLLEAA